MKLGSPASCPTCGRGYWFESDAPFGIGRIRAVHPPGPCVPVVVYEWEPEDEYRPPRNGRGGDSPVLLHRTCAWKPCGKPFSTYAPARKCCSDSCREARRRKLNRAANLRYWYRTKRKRDLEGRAA